MNKILEKHVISSEVAPKILDWLSRGPVALYRSVNLSNPGGSWLVPAGQGKPNWQSANEPVRLLTTSDFVVVRDVECKRLHIALRRGGNGLMIKLTEGSSNRVRKAVARAGDGAFYRFEADEAVIMKPEGAAIPLATWAA